MALDARLRLIDKSHAHCHPKPHYFETAVQNLVDLVYIYIRHIRYWHPVVMIMITIRQAASNIARDMIYKNMTVRIKVESDCISTLVAMSYD